MTTPDTEEAVRRVRLQPMPLSLREANDAVSKWHRHHQPVRFHLFSIGAMGPSGLCGAIIVMRPATQGRSFQGFMAEVSRLATDGTANACSFLLGAAARTAFNMGYMGIQTYTLASEGGASLRAAGWEWDGVVKPKPWSTTRRQRNDAHPMVEKIRWVRINAKRIVA